MSDKGVGCMRYRLERIVFCFVAMSFAGVVAASAQPLTFARDDEASVTGARGIVSVDLDGDGWLDVATANTGRNSVAILLNRKGTLTKTLEITVGSGPFDITSADFDRDGKADLAVTNADSNSITLLYGNGDGTFPRTSVVSATSLTSPRAIRAADMNGDGIMDLVVTGYTSNSVAILLGTGSGAFTGPRFVGYAPQPQGVAIADFNHDGRLDIAVAYDSTGGLAIMYGDGSSNVVAAPKAVGGPAQYLNVVATGDFNGDGWMDVAAASTKNNVASVYLGSPTGLNFSASYSVGTSPRGIVVADVTGDGMLDLIVANYGSSTVSVVIGNKAHPGAFTGEVQFAAGSGSRAVAVADFDHDARIDVAAGDQNASAVTVLVNQTGMSAAGFSFTKTLVGPGSGDAGSSNHVEVADFNRDGKLDLATLGDHSDILIYLTGGATVSLVPHAPYYVDVWHVGDFNNDGNPDVITLFYYPSPTITVFLGNGKGAFTKLDSSSPIQVDHYTLADMNGDGRTDIVFDAYDSSTGGYDLGVLYGNGDGTFRFGMKMAIPDQPVQLAAADFDRDGKVDVAVMNWPSGLGIWKGFNGTSWPDEQGYNVDLPNIVTGMTVGDVNKDGNLDLILTTDQQMALMLGGEFNFQDPVYFDQQSVGGNWYGPAIADINMDGKPDLITDQGVVQFGNGDGTFQSPQRFDSGMQSYGVAVADMNADGLPDLLFGNTFTQVTVLSNKRNTVNHPPTVTTSDFTGEYQAQFGEDGFTLVAFGSDPDAHYVTYVWRDQNGAVVSNYQYYEVYPPLPPGTYPFTVTASDGRGGSATASATLTITPTKEIVIWAADGQPQGPAWTKAADSTAAGGLRAYNPNHNAAKIDSPSANPTSYYAVGFIADPTQTYKLWIRLKADYNASGNDSVWVQFSGSTDAAGHPAYQQGTTSGLSVNLEECAGCGESGWGWEDDGWGSVNKNGVTLRFPDGKFHEIFIQQREDGVSIDQIVLSSERYLTTRPGAAKNDTTIVPRTYQPE